MMAKGSSSAVARPITCGRIDFGPAESSGIRVCAKAGVSRNSHCDHDGVLVASPGAWYCRSVRTTGAVGTVMPKRRQHVRAEVVSTLIRAVDVKDWPSQGFDWYILTQRPGGRTSGPERSGFGCSSWCSCELRSARAAFRVVLVPIVRPELRDRPDRHGRVLPGRPRSAPARPQGLVRARAVLRLQQEIARALPDVLEEAAKSIRSGTWERRSRTGRPRGWPSCTARLTYSSHPCTGCVFMRQTIAGHVHEPRRP
ncbi:hypothetical protein SAMN04489726_0942 [Allokutzneria albata]|uniref:Uncharacterized protein n=1 Tax=Allokutzneria albata TaxID=211114 RepID=A0A1G9S7T8_ALLAB|nr:hypothetical protein SAMN04489726_0942 [Allokutzneria albata]